MLGPVLLVHDDIAVIAPAKRVLQRHGIDTLLVTNAGDAVITFGDLAPRVVVLSPSVDGGRGEQIYNDMRASPRGNEARFLFLGAAVASAGPDAVVLPLPLDGKALLDAVEHALEQGDVAAAWRPAAPEPPPASFSASPPAGLDDDLLAPPAEGPEGRGSTTKPFGEPRAICLPASPSPPAGPEDDLLAEPIPLPSAGAAPASEDDLLAYPAGPPSAPAASFLSPAQPPAVESTPSPSGFPFGRPPRGPEPRAGWLTPSPFSAARPPTPPPQFRTPAPSRDAPRPERARSVPPAAPPEEALRQTVEQLAADMRASAESLRQLQAEAERLRAARSQAEQQLLSITAEREQLRRQLAEIQARREELESDLEAGRREAAEAAAGLGELERAVAEDRARAQAARERVEQARQRLEQARAQSLAETQAAEARCRQLEAELSQLRAQVAAERTRRLEKQRRLEEQRQLAERELAARGDRVALSSVAPEPMQPGEEGGRVSGTRPRPVRLADLATGQPEEEEGAQPAAWRDTFPAQGTLAEHDPARLVGLAFAARLTGGLVVAAEEAERTLWFEEGRLVGAESTAQVERLEAIALRLGLISASQHHALRTCGENAARPLAMRMVELGYLKPAEMVPLVRQRVQEIAYSTFLDQSSPFRVRDQTVPADERVVLPLHPYALATEGIRRKYSAERLHALLGGPATILRLAGPRLDLEPFGLSAREKRLVARADGLRTLEEILLEGGLEEAAALRVLWALVAAGVFEIAVRGPAASSAQGEKGLDRARIAEKYAQVLSGDYFQILGLRRDATGYEVHDAYQRLSRELDPSRWADCDDPALVARLEEIGRALAEAADVLSDDAVRAEYARQLVD